MIWPTEEEIYCA